MNERTRLVATGLPAGALSSASAVELTEGWELAKSDPGAHAAPADLPGSLPWRSAVVPGTVATSVGPEDLDRHENYDASDWWYRCRVRRPPDAPDADRVQLRLDGLATLSEVWFNGELVLESSNMFCAYEVDVTDLITDDNEITIVFRSLDAAIAEPRPRPRWRTKLVDHQQLRWFRTTLLGRIPAWTPPIRPVGPWRPVWIESMSGVELASLDLHAGVTGSDGVVHVDARLRDLGGHVDVESAALQVDGTRFQLELVSDGGAWRVHGEIRVPDPELWWPATHGQPVLHPCSIVLLTSIGEVTIDCGRVGFRHLRLDETDGRIQFLLNGVPLFCRGSCWTNNDIVSLAGRAERMRGILELTTSAHANMIRVGGTMVYETDEFYRACDELGLMVWQDFMFANMDYPVDDPSFAASIRAEADQQVRRLSRHASLVAFCGGSEVQQQAAMFGAPREVWSNEFFEVTLPELIGGMAPGTPYWPSTPTGGALPFHVAEGLAHYYGVGAYKRPLSDARLAGVKFTPECLGFSNVPEAPNLRKLSPAGAVPPHHPAWKAGVPRDSGPGWDFEDVRDFYLEELYSVHAVELRSQDLERYLELSRSVTGAVMESVFAEWRREGDVCGGALTWFLNDLRPGAGWGLIDSDGEPKAALYHLRRAWAPCCVRLVDRGLDGLIAVAFNDGAVSRDVVVGLSVLGPTGHGPIEWREQLRLPPRSVVEVSVERAFGHFLDPTYSYRFGPRRHEAIVARLLSVGDDSDLISETMYVPQRSLTPFRGQLGVSVATEASGSLEVTLVSDAALYDVRLEVPGYRPDDNHFDLAPRQHRIVRMRRLADTGRAFRGYVEAANLAEAVRLPSPA